jgi:hypothetical protein
MPDTGDAMAQTWKNFAEAAREELDKRILTNYKETQMRNSRMHTTKQGDTMLIAQMTNVHLVNQLNLMVRKFRDAQHVLLAPENSKFTKALYGDILSTDQAEQYANWFMERFPFYLFEAQVRKLLIEDLLDELREILGRTDPLPRQNLISLPEDSEDLDWEET